MIDMPLTQPRNHRVALRLLCGMLAAVLLLGGATFQASGQTKKAAPRKPAAGKGEAAAGLSKETNALLAEFRRAAQADDRAELSRKILAQGAGAAKALATLLDEQLAAAEKKYIQTLDRYIRDAYLQRLTKLSDEQIYQVQMTRRLWRHYLLTTATQHEFQKNFLQPCAETAKTLLLKIDEVQDESVASQRRLLVELAGYQAQCFAAMNVSPDPTKGKVSPTGLPYPPLDRPPTFADNLSYLERSLVLAGSVAPRGARNVLLMNAQAAREIDVEEAEYVLFGNEVRMLTGTIAWAVDPLLCACMRDHSNDRKEGKAQAHSSTVPGKESFPARTKRFGTSAASEGAGGGRDGRNYIHGLSYGGGHTGPLYSLKRNVVGVGRRGGVYTSGYRTEKKLLHPCPVQDGEQFMPPGLGRADLRSPALMDIYRSIGLGNFARADAAIRKTAGKNDQEKMLLRFFAAAVKVELDWRLGEVGKLLAVGDVYEARRRLDAVHKQFANVEGLAERIKPLDDRLSQEGVAAEIKAGGYYHGMANSPVNTAALQAFVKQFPNSVYAEAAKLVLQPKADDAKNGPGLLSYFLQKDPTLSQFDYEKTP